MRQSEDEEMPPEPEREDMEVNLTPEKVRVGNTMHVYNDDGSVDIDLNPEIQKKNKVSAKHFENLADILDDKELQLIADTLMSAVESDKTANQKWYQTGAEGLSQLGIGLGSEKNMPQYQWSSKVYSSAMMEILQNLRSIVQTELLPPSGPADIKILGIPTEDKEDKAQRWKDYSNYYLTEVYKAFSNEVMDATGWALMLGSGFVRVYIDPITNMIKTPSIAPDTIYMNPGAKNLSEASRITYNYTISNKDLRMRMKSGFYREISLGYNDGEDDTDQNPLTERIEKISGKNEINYDYESSHSIYESQIDIDIENLSQRDLFGKKDGLPLPFIVTIETESRKILRMVRNWEKGDETYKRIDLIVQFQAIPGIDIYGLGLTQICVSNAKASTGLTRQLIDLGVLNNFPGGFKSKGVKVAQNDKYLGPGEWLDIDMMGAEDISKVFMPLPYREPSMVLKTLKDDLDTNSRNLMGAATISLDDINTNAPASTTLPILEQLNRNQNSIMRRFHSSMGDLLQLVFKLFPDMLPDEPYPFKISGSEHTLLKEDFSPDLAIVPVSDPNLNSSTLRNIRAQAMFGLAQQQPDLFDMHEVTKRVLKEMKVEDIDKILPPPQKEEEPTPLDPITENMNAMSGKPLTVFIAQNHQAHITTHQAFAQSQQEQNPEADLSPMQAHITEHQTYIYLQEMQNMMHEQLPEDPSQLTPEQQNEIAQKAADALMKQQKEEQAANPPPMDPTAVMDKQVDVDKARNEMKAQIDTMKLENDKLRIDLDMFKAQSKNEIDRLKIDTDFRLKEAELELKGIQVQAPQSLENINMPDTPPIELHQPELGNQGMPDNSQEQPQG